MIKKEKVKMAKRKPKIDELFDIELVVQAMEQHCPRHPNSRGLTYREIAELYKKSVVEQATVKTRDVYQFRMNLYNLSLDKIRNNLGRYSLNGSKHYWRYWFEQQPFSLYTIISKGSNMTEQNTIVKLNFEFASAGEIAHWTPQQIEANFPVGTIDSGDIDGYWYTQIDQASLSAYIRATEAALRAGSYDKHSEQFVPLNKGQRATYTENLKIAQAIQVLSRENGRLKQGVKQSAFGRLYFKGINLQNCHTTVRIAALGNCHGYDLVSASQAWRMHECQKIQPGSYPYTQELLENRNIFRRRVAHIMQSQDMDLAKRVLTSIGFGANITDRPWPSGRNDRPYELPALRELLTDVQLTQLTGDAWFMGFIAEQNRMNDIIYKHFQAKIPKQDYPKEILNKSGSIVKNKALAWLYQHAEFYILHELYEFIKTRCPEENILLLVHDAVYLKMSINMADLQGLVQQLNPYLKLEHQRHQGYEYEDVFGILEHKERIKQEETQALRYQLTSMLASGWDDAEYRACHPLFAREYDKMLDKSSWTEEDHVEYQRLHDLYYMTWFKDILMGNKNWRLREDYQRFQRTATNIEYSDGSDGTLGYYD